MRKLFILSVLLVLSVLATGQIRVITGRITDQGGQPIPFSTIRIKGTKAGTSADADGNFSIRAKPGDVLLISGTGINSREVSVTDAAALNTIQVTRSATALAEVIVTALGVQRQSKELGYATARISTKELTQAKVIDISTGLQGKVSGLQVNLTNNGVDPSTRIVLRGNRSITGNNQALIVLDGVPIDDVSYINKINPEDIESVNVLKGAVAASLYGSKASNGVLVITTKHGTRGKPSIVIGNTIDLETVSYLPNLQNRFGAYGGEGAYTNPDGTVLAVPYENQSYGPPFNGAKLPLAIFPVFAADGITVDHYDTLYSAYSAIPGEKRKFFNTGITNQLDVSYSAGDEKGTFYMGFQDAAIKGVVPKDKSRRDNIRIGGTRDYGHFKADYSVSYNQRKDDVVGLSYNQTNGGVFSGRPIYFELINAPSNIPITRFKDWKNDVLSSPDGYYNAYASNPYWTIDNSRRVRNTYDLFGNANLSFKVTPWLTVSDRLGLVQTTQQWKYTRAGITFAPWAISDPWGAGNIPSSLKTLKPSDYDQSYLEQRLNNDLVAAFDKTIGDISVKALAGWNFAQRYQRTLFLEGDNLQFPGFYNISSVLGVPGYGESSFKQRETSIYEDVTVGFKDFLYLHLSNRDEWNSVLDPARQHFEYPGADLSFVFTQAIGAFKNNKVLTYGKIRGGVTQVANINLGTNPYGAYSLINPFNPAGGFPFGNIGGYSQSSTYLNPLIKPEKTTAGEVGVDLGFYENRISFQGAYYKSITKDQTLIAQLSAANGFTSKVVNAGQVTNHGLEFDLNLTVIKNKDWNWTVGGNYAWYKNRVDDLLPGVNELQLGGLGSGVSGGIYAVKGSPYPVIKTTDWLRDSTSGKVIVDGVTGRPSIDATNKIFGNTNPTNILGLKTSLSFKGLTLGLVLDYRSGNYIINTIGSYLDFTGISEHSAQNGRQRFIFPNSVIADGSGKYVPNTSVAVDNGGNIGGAGFWPDVYTNGIGSVYITSAAYWKLREASLTYEIPARVLSTITIIKKAVVGVVGRNLLMFRPKSNLWTDPEFAEDNSNAIGRTSEFQLPPTRMYGFNLVLTF